MEDLCWNYLYLIGWLLCLDEIICPLLHNGIVKRNFYDVLPGPISCQYNGIWKGEPPTVQVRIMNVLGWNWNAADFYSVLHLLG